MPSETSSAQASKLQESDLQGLNPEDYEILDDTTELTTRRKSAGRPKVKTDIARVSQNKIVVPGLGQVTLVIH